MDEVNTQKQIEALLAERDTVRRQIERRKHTLKDGDQQPAPHVQIKLRNEIQEFQSKLKSIEIQLTELIKQQGGISADEQLSVRQQELIYLNDLKSAYGPLIDIYTELSIRGRSQGDKIKVKKSALPFLDMHHDVFSQISHAFEEDDSNSFSINTFDELLNTIMEYKRVALIGEPGSGKSVTLQRITYELAAKAIESNLNPLPLYIPLGSYAGQAVNEFFGQFFDELSFSSHLPHRVLLLLDGLNETPIEWVQHIEDWLRANQLVSVVVSCRKLDYLERKLPLRRVDIASLDVKQIYTFIGNFFEDSDRDRLFWALAGPEARAAWDWYRREGGFGATFDGFWFGRIEHARSYEVDKTNLKRIQDDLRGPQKALPGILGLVTNPFLLFTVIPIYMHNEEPPKNRGELFEQFTNLLIDKRGKTSVRPEHPWISETTQKAIMSTLAHRMLQERQGTGVDESWVREVLRTTFPEHNPENLVYLAASAGILESKYTGTKSTIRFTHQLLQEYFAALKMAEDIEKNRSAKEYWPSTRWWEPTGWEETALLLAGIQRDATNIVKWLTPVHPTLAYQCATECGVPCNIEALEMLYEPPLGERASPIARAEWGRILASRGDSRPGVGVDVYGIPDIVWCKVPAGKFLMGGDEELRPLGLSWGRLEIELPYSFWIGKYPVTYSQFETFLKEGYQNRRYWTAYGWRWKGSQQKPRLWDDPIYNITNHPVVGVTWYEAYAFTQWLNEKLHSLNYRCPDPEISLWEISLPLEVEWERAARFPNNRRYPWGDEYVPGYANIDETYQDAECGPYALRHSTAVGLYEAGKSELGIYDLCGNVWEWCLSKWDVEYTYPEDSNPEGSEHRGVRGGSWYNSVKFAPAAAHDCQDADLGVNDVGFRIVLSPLQRHD